LIDLGGYLNANGVPTLEMPFWEIFRSIVIIMGIPLVLGILVAQYKPKIADALKKPLQKLSIVVFIAMVVIIFTGNMDTFLKCIKYIALIVFVHNLLALGIGYGSGSLLKVPYKDRRTLTIESGIQNSGLGLALLFNPNIFDPAIWGIDGQLGGMGGMMVITAWWGVWHIVSGLTLASLWRWKGRKEPNEA
jgi:BASS family bile acid:Na+ symporter